MTRRGWACLAGALVALLPMHSASADGENVDATAETVDDVVRVTLLKSGDAYSVREVRGSSRARAGCRWSVLFTPELSDAPYGISAGPKPDPAARFALLLCNGSIVRAIWVTPSDVTDLDAAVQAEAERYVREVLTPAVSIGANPSAKGLAGLRSWFWVEGFSGQVTAPPITAFGLTIEVRMSAGTVTWTFGDGVTERGDLGRAYPEESSVRHAYRDAGSYAVAADIELVPQYRVGGGPWLTLPNLSAAAGTTHVVEQRQPVVSDA